MNDFVLRLERFVCTLSDLCLESLDIQSEYDSLKNSNDTNTKYMLKNIDITKFNLNHDVNNLYDIITVLKEKQKITNRCTNKSNDDLNTQTTSVQNTTYDTFSPSICLSDNTSTGFIEIIPHNAPWLSSKS